METNNQQTAENAAPVIEEQTETESLKSELDNQSERLLRVNEKLAETEIRLALLMSGAAKEKLADAYPLAKAVCRTGKTPEEAAADIVSAYPHLRAVQREIPQFSASGAGEGDGFSAIRKIFSAK